MKTEVREDGLGRTLLMFWCAGCDTHHQVTVPPTPRVTGSGPWEWDGNREAPTIRPSVLVTYEYGEGRVKKVCHSFVTAGHIQYLADCTHVLAGKTVPLEDLPE